MPRLARAGGQRQVKADNVKELIALARRSRDKLNYGSYGIGTYAHLSMEDFKQRTGTDIVHVPYRGAAQANDLLAGSMSMLLLNLSSIEAHEKTGKVKILAAATGSAWPPVPTCRRSPRPAPAASRPRSGSRCGDPPTCRRRWSGKIHEDVSKVLDLPQSTREFFKTNSFERVDLRRRQFGH